jgi:hypothetical protein
MATALACIVHQRQSTARYRHEDNNYDPGLGLVHATLAIALRNFLFAQRRSWVSLLAVKPR